MDQFEKFFAQSLKFLSYRPRSEKEVRDKLVSKKTPEDIIEKVIIKLKENKFLNDKDFTEWFVRSRLSSRPKSARVIKMELKQKGIDKDLIETQNFGQDLESAKKLVLKKIEKYKSFEKKEIYNKLGAYLARRGYDWDTIKNAIDEAFDKVV